MTGAAGRGGKVVAKAVSKDKLEGRNMAAFVRDWIRTDKTLLVTGECTGCLGTSKIGPRSVIKHAWRHADGDIHTNGIECSWSLLKRGMFGQFHSVSGRHLQGRVDEFRSRFNRRRKDPEAAFFD